MWHIKHSLIEKSILIKVPRRENVIQDHQQDQENAHKSKSQLLYPGVSANPGVDFRAGSNQPSIGRPDARRNRRINKMQATGFYVPKSQLNAIATRALIDEDFKAGVLNGKRSQKIQEYPLPEPVQKEVMEIQAKDVRQFIYGLQAIIEQTRS